MNKAILAEINYFIALFFVGAILFFVYDGLRIIRHIIKHHRIIVSIEDLVFWVGASFYVFSIIYEKNHGTIRWYSIAALGLGMFIYHRLISDLFVLFFVKIIKRLLGLIKKVLGIILRPFRFIFRKIRKFLLFIAGKCKKRAKKIFLILQKRLKKRKEKIKIRQEEKQAKKALKKKTKEKEPEAVSDNKSPKGSFELIRQPEEEKGESNETHKEKKKRKRT